MKKINKILASIGTLFLCACAWGFYIWIADGMSSSPFSQDIVYMLVLLMAVSFPASIPLVYITFKEIAKLLNYCYGNWEWTLKWNPLG